VVKCFIHTTVSEWEKVKDKSIYDNSIVFINNDDKDTVGSSVYT
jgi:hypothetical protein